jgi:tripartite ATP-independent transporter DctM subunit
MSVEFAAQECTAGRTCVGIIPPLSKVESAYNAYTRILLMFSAVLIGLLVIPITADIICRTFLRMSIGGMMEVETMTLVVLAFSCMAYTIVVRAPIQIDLFYLAMKGRNQARLDLFSNSLCLFICLILAFATFHETVNMATLTAVLRIPEKYFMAWTFIAFASIAVGMVFQVVHSLRELRAMKDTAGIAAALAVALLLVLLPFLYRWSGLRLSGLVVGGIGFALLMALLMIRMPIGLAMSTIGFLGLVALLRLPRAAMGGMEAFSDFSHFAYVFRSAYASIASVPFRNTSDFIFVAMPMFMLMGELALHSGLSADLFDCANKWLGRLPGGLAIASVGGCAGFGAVCGDSFACVITMSSVALPQMRAKKYDPSLSCGALAAGGTLGILIPPSMGFIFYSIMTEESIGRLFIAGILPGILLASIFMTIIAFQVVRNPALAPRAAHFSMKEKLLSTLYLVPVAGLFVVVVGGIMQGAFTPGEGGAVGAAGAFLYAVARRRLTWKKLADSCRNTALMSGKIFLIFAGVYIFGQFLASSRLPHLMAESILNLHVNRYLVFAVVCVLYIILGCVMNIIPMMMLTLPSIYPTIQGLGFDGIWFGVVTVILMEMGMITPPVGMNVFTLSSLVPDIPMGKIFKGVIPFFLGMILCVIILTIFPQIALYLPNSLM